jgi:hypothetical protein
LPHRRQQQSKRIGSCPIRSVRCKEAQGARQVGHSLYTDPLLCLHRQGYMVRSTFLECRCSPRTSPFKILFDFIDPINWSWAVHTRRLIRKWKFLLSNYLICK